MRRNLKIFLALTIITLLVSIAYASSLMNPSTQYTGQGEPVGTNFREGDTYIDTASLNVWVFNGTSWVTFARFVQPPINGTNGTDGIDGATWYLVTQDPTTLPDFGKDGDFCLDSSIWNIWYKSNDCWLLVGNIKGADGMDGVDGINGIDGKDGVDGVDGINGIDGKDGVDGVDGINGTDGVNGSIWYNDLAFSFSEDLGNNGDYFMFTNGTVEYKMGGQWVYFTSLMGLTGATGATGAAGATGPAGITGATGAIGPAGADGIGGIDGKDGVDGSIALNGVDGQDGVVPWWIYIITVGALGTSAYSVHKSRKKNK